MPLTTERDKNLALSDSLSAMALDFLGRTKSWFWAMRPESPPNGVVEVVIHTLLTAAAAAIPAVRLMRPIPMEVPDSDIP